ncbi:MAG: sodium:solute symporter, partial [Chitinophagaceae bacterium]|nr:sodium:solute symporter [Chitinophagaceae bacterium]
GGFFLALSYFGTDQSQVGRYLTAKDNTESRVGLLMNGLVKVPMQFFILLIGALLFTFYQFKQQPIFFNNAQQEKLLVSSKKDSAILLQNQFVLVNNEKQKALQNFKVDEEKSKQDLKQLNVQSDALRKQYKGLIKSSEVKGDDNDTNYIFLRFVVDYLPKGLVGLLIAIIFLAAWGSIAAALNSLASCTMIDFHKRFNKKNINDISQQQCEADYKTSKLYTLAWGVFSVIVAEFATGMGSLIEAVNVLGSLFYGVILGIFLVGFYLKKIQSNAVFIAAILGELIVITIFVLDKIGVIGLGFLWLNVIGAVVVVLLSLVLQALMPKKQLVS